MHVLLVEDDPGIREGLVELLTEFGTVSAAADVPSAEAVLEREQFDLVITDLHLGGDPVAGRTIARAARDRRCRVVVMSGAPRQEIDRVLDGGAPDGVIEKPFDVDDVVAMMELEQERADRPSS